MADITKITEEMIAVEKIGLDRKSIKFILGKK
jgi:hypothetical protein